MSNLANKGTLTPEPSAVKLKFLFILSNTLPVTFRDLLVQKSIRSNEMLQASAVGH